MIKKLKEAFEPYVETALPRAMENAFYGQPHGHKEGVSGFLVFFQRAQAVNKDEAMTLPTKLLGTFSSGRPIWIITSWRRGSSLGWRATTTCAGLRGQQEDLL